MDLIKEFFKDMASVYNEEVGDRDISELPTKEIPVGKVGKAVIVFVDDLPNDSLNALDEIADWLTHQPKYQRRVYTNYDPSNIDEAIERLRNFRELTDDIEDEVTSYAEDALVVLWVEGPEQLPSEEGNMWLNKLINDLVQSKYNFKKDPVLKHDKVLFKEVDRLLMYLDGYYS